MGTVPLDFSGSWELAEGGFRLVFCGDVVLLFGAGIGPRRATAGGGKILKGCMRKGLRRRACTHRHVDARSKWPSCELSQKLAPEPQF